MSNDSNRRVRREKKDGVNIAELIDLGNEKGKSTCSVRRAACNKWNRYLSEIGYDPENITADIITEELFGKFADFLMKFDDPSYITAKNYLSSIKNKLCEDFPVLKNSIFDEGRNQFYTNTHSNMKKMFLADAEARERAIMNKATPALPVPFQ